MFSEGDDLQQDFQEEIGRSWKADSSNRQYNQAEPNRMSSDLVLGGVHKLQEPKVPLRQSPPLPFALETAGGGDDLQAAVRGEGGWSSGPV